MSLWTAAELYALLVGACLIGLAAAVRWFSDDRDRSRMVTAHIEADRAPDLFAHALEEIRNLPERERWTV